MEKTENAQRVLSVAEWHRLCQEGAELHVRIPVNGISMQPLIRKNRDIVTILPLRKPPKRGDIVLFQRQGRQVYVLHRLWRAENGRVMTWGDNCPFPDGWMDQGQVWGIAAALQRGKHSLRLDTAAACRAGLLLAHARHAYCRARQRVYRMAAGLPAPCKAALKRLMRRGAE